MVSALLLGGLFGAVSSFLAHYWLLFFGEFSLWTVSGVVTGYTVLLALVFAILKGLSQRLSASPSMVMALAWVVWEYMKSSGFLAFPWGLTAHTVSTILPLIQVASLTGVWGVSLLVVLVNAAVADALLGRSIAGGADARSRRSHAMYLRPPALVGGLLVVALTYGVLRMEAQPRLRATIPVLLVQHNADPWLPDQEDEAFLRAERLTVEGLARSKVELVIWSETIIPYLVREERIESFLRSYPRQSPLQDLLTATGKPLLLGSPFRAIGDAGYQNAALLLSARGELLGHYGKQHLVPFAEYVPLWHVRFVREFVRGTLGLSQGWQPGPGPVLLDLPTDNGVVRIGAPVCFEDSFPDLCRTLVQEGADVLVNLTNVSWSKRESAMTQMLVAGRFRSVENHTALVRGTNGGITSVIDWTGRIIASAEMFSAVWLNADVPLYRDAGETPYSRFGDVLPVFLALLLVVLLLDRGTTFRKRSPTST
jgi:apolipoprotein N-acyltransferase